MFYIIKLKYAILIIAYFNYTEFLFHTIYYIA